MITAIVQYKLPPHIGLAACAAHFRGIAPDFRDVPGLIRKQFIYAEDGWAGGVYLWHTRAAAEAFYAGPWLDGIRERYGMDPQIKLFETACITDNEIGAVLLPDADGQPGTSQHRLRVPRHSSPGAAALTPSYSPRRPLPLVSFAGNSRILGCVLACEPLRSAIVTAVDELVRPDRYPRSSRYDPAWLLDLDMGPNPLWLLEDLARDLDLRPGMRVLDLGSGKGATSVFLAREYGVQVMAADWWVGPDEAAAVFARAGVADKVTAVRAEAHALPFGKDSFDAVVSIDAFEYFGTADGYLPYLVGFLRPGGQLGVATPGMTREVRELGAIPQHIKKLVGWEAIAWHTAEWWRFHWEITELVTVTSARLQQDGWGNWLQWARALAERAGDRAGRRSRQAVIDMLTTDGGEFLTFALMTARKNQSTRD